MIPNWNKILKEWSYRVGVIKPSNNTHLYHLNKILEERGWPYDIIVEFVNNLTEADEDDKYVHIGYGKYKEKGKEDDKKASTFSKTDSGKYVKVGDDKEKPKGKPLDKGDFERNFDDKDKIQNKTDFDDNNKTQDNWEKIDDKNNHVKNIRDYSDKEYEEETGEYFENEKTSAVVPNAFKNKEDMIQKMKSAKPVYLSSEKMEFMDNTDTGKILNSDNALELGKEKAKEYGKDWDRLEKGIESGAEVPPPIAFKDKNDDYYLLAGNTRLMSFTASGKKLPIKVIDYDGEFQYDAFKSKNESLNEIAPTDMVSNPNPKGRADKVQYQYAKQWMDDNPDAETSDDFKADVGQEKDTKKKKSKISREDIDSIDGDSKSKALDKKEKAPGNDSSVINEIGVGIGMSHLSDNPDTSVDELEDKLYDEMMNTKIGKKNGKDATRNACRAAAKSAKREYTRTQKTIQKNDMNPETTKTSHVWGSKDSLQGTVDYLEKMGVKEVNGIPFEEYKKIILEGGAGKNPTDTMIVMVDDSKKPPKAIINHTSNKTSSNDIQGNSGPDKNADYVMNKADEDLENGKITKEEHEQITEEMTRLREDFINAQNQIEELINEQFERMEDDINDSKKRKELLNRVKNLSTGEKPAKYWEQIAKRYAKQSGIDLKGRELDYKSGTYNPPLTDDEEAQILMSYQKEMKDFANQEKEAVEPPKWATEIMARKDMYPPPEQDLNDLYRVQHSLISETRKTVDKIKSGYGTEVAAQNMFERLHLDVVEGHNPGGIPTENFEVNMGNNDSGRKYDKDGNAYHHTGAGRYQKVNPKTGELEGDKFRPKRGELTEGDSAVIVNPTTIAGALGVKPPVKNLASRIRVSEVKSGKGKSGVATIYGTTVNGKEIIIGYQTIRPKQGPGSKHQDTIQFHSDFQKRLVEQTEKLDD